MSTRSRDPAGARTARRRAAAALAAVAACAALAASTGAPGRDLSPFPPPGEPVLVLAGRGFGHGVGMSQHGARGAAQAGLDAEAILAHYYRGATIGRAEPEVLRVLVRERAASVRLSVDTAGRASDGAGVWSGAVRLERERSYEVVARGGRVALGSPEGRTLVPPTDSLAVQPAAGGGTIAVDGRRYRGALRVSAAEGAVDVVNVVGLEDYLRGVVPSEMPASWAEDTPEAARAQAIAARSYALAVPRAAADFDLHDDQRSQVYGGVDAEDPRTDRAVAATRGRVLRHDGRIAIAYYSSSSGGHTEDGGNVFPSEEPTPYLTGAPDPYDAGAPLHRWPRPPAFTPRELARRLGVAQPVHSIRPLRRGASPRVLEAHVHAGLLARPLSVSGARLRAALELPDTWFDVVRRRVATDGGPAALPDDPARADVWLAVLNGAGVAGLAGRTAERAEELGYRAVTAADAPPQPPGAAVVYHRPQAGPRGAAAAARVAADLGIGDVRALAAGDPVAAEAPAAAHVVVVLAPEE